MSHDWMIWLLALAFVVGITVGALFVWSLCCRVADWWHENVRI